MTLQVGLADALMAVEAADIDKHLNELERRLTEPTLLTLTNGKATMHIGLGNPDHSVALFCDESGRLWASRGGETTVELAEGRTPLRVLPIDGHLACPGAKRRQRIRCH
jgi:hypothetical protein